VAGKRPPLTLGATRLLDPACGGTAGVGDAHEMEKRVHSKACHRSHFPSVISARMMVNARMSRQTSFKCWNGLTLTNRDGDPASNGNLREMWIEQRDRSEDVESNDRLSFRAGERHLGHHRRQLDVELSLE
jgi:hypothetical protein